MRNHTNYINIGNIEGRLKSILKVEEIKQIESELADRSKQLKSLQEQKRYYLYNLIKIHMNK